MNKATISTLELQKVIQTTQAIEGYKQARPDVVERVKQLRVRYGIKVSPRK
jgi:hypothetical protein